MSADQVFGSIFMVMATGVVALILWSLGLASGEDSVRIEAIKNNAACYLPDKKGKPEFVWNCERKEKP